ncbi:hypothetical protein MVEG_11730 [Podila verticillata NRRL 6337]|uniref:Uncharacterized protein n=1 Tax=Podila verticillata NRRL 6337 TaxID=1069443 RepID=A0A086TJG4_9FUNG|nr:hypothetical protein MVEG_11730 [Podila verticillata NRRL 6337]
MVPRPSRTKASFNQPSQDSNVEAGPSQTPQGSSQASQEVALPPSESPSDQELHDLALGEARAQKSVALPPSFDGVGGLPDQSGPSPSLAELMDNPMDMCPDVPVDPVQQFKDLLAVKQQEVARISTILAGYLSRAQKAMNSQPPESHQALSLQCDAATAPLDAQLNRLDIEIARIKLSLARLAPPSILQEISSSSMGGAPPQRPPPLVLDASNVSPDLNKPYHQSLVRFGNLKFIPVDPSTGEVDFDRVTLPSISKSPVLDLSAQLKGVKRKDFEVKYVEAIFQFLNRFERFFRNELTDLFDILAWKYMSSALVKVDQDQRFDKMMQSITPFTAHTWSRVETCIGSIFGLSSMSGEILEKLFAFKAFHQEDTEAFARRFESLLRASGLVDSTGHSCIPHEILVGIIYRAVPELGQNLIISRFKDLRQISDFGALLDFIRQTSGLLNGSHAWAGRWAASLWAPDLVTKDPGSSSTPVQAGNKRRRSRSPGRGNRSRPVPRLQESHANTGLPDGQQWCTHLPCLKLSKRHWDISCRRHKHKQGSKPYVPLSTPSSSSSGPFQSSQRFTP